ncbi:HSPB1-associated protein 1 [Copidosoma floridanum]|uniref:HSPB1-associated protein 1 n=1 Tax=Copidosoma floridanum TaxID=29053 RepID=UPI0006C9D825|nr:HSPB1-associated protein 1 [Copidosoma floridanum]
MCDKDKEIRELLYALEEPVVFKNVLETEGTSKWKLLDWSLEDLANKLENQTLPFRVGKNTKTINPQWEVDTPIEHMSLKEFLNKSQGIGNLSNWFYFDYKYMRKWFKEKSDILESLNWKSFGFDFDGSDSTMWIGNRGAHTNCHQDSYGCNLVAQIHGRKLWLLFSPKCTNVMQPTRVPFEESTIFSKYNFFTPNKKEIEAIQSTLGNVKMIILEPKDVLFVPKGWWHYVESLEVSMSVNVWLPVKEDCYSRLKESLVHLIANTVGQDVVPRTVNQQESDLLESIKLIERSLAECKQPMLKDNQKLLKNQEMPKINDDESVLKDLNYKYSNCCSTIPNLTNENMSQFLEKNNINTTSNVDSEEINENDEASTLEILEAVVDAFCHPDVTSKVSQILRDKFIHKNINIS